MLEQLQNSAFSTWVTGSDSLWAYPTVLTLHTVGLGIVVGAAILLNLRLLGVGADIPLTEMRPLFRFFWVGFVINLISGLVLFAAEAADKAKQPVFFVKLALIAAAVNTVFGLIVAWVLARYRFPGRRVLDALVDLPLALPTAVAGIALTAVYSRNAWFGATLARSTLRGAAPRKAMAPGTFWRT